MSNVRINIEINTNKTLPESIESIESSGSEYVPSQTPDSEYSQSSIEYLESSVEET